MLYIREGVCDTVHIESDIGSQGKQGKQGKQGDIMELNKEDQQPFVAGRMSILNELAEELKTNDADTLTISRWRLKEMLVAECQAMMKR